MLCVVVKGPSYQEIQEELTQASIDADLVELRIDLFSTIHLSSMRELRSQFPIPMIFTLRSQLHGGAFKGSEKERLSHIEQLATLNPEYLDIEADVSQLFLQKLSSSYPKIKLILSHHDFTPQSEISLQKLNDLYLAMQRAPASWYKIALKFEKTVDTLSFLLWARKSQGKIIPISMGEEGALSRILAPLISAPLTYCSLKEDPNPLGQLSAKTLRDIYHYHMLTPQTSLYGLIGDPVNKSVSDQRHNYVFKKCGIDALYVKITISPQDLSTFLVLAKQFPFKGISVTMPLKEAILSHLTHISPEAKKVGAVNTLVLQEDEYIGCNTDGRGALDAIEKHLKVKNKKILVLGAGGAAKAIIYEALKRGAYVMIANRDLQKAQTVAEKFSCEATSLHSPLPRDYAILINCTPAEMPISIEDILQNTFIMDIKTKPKKLPLLEKATELGAKALSGNLMFVNQALSQYSYWFKSSHQTEQMGFFLSEILSLEKDPFFS